ncbi:MAG: DUF6932 family protein [Acidimicrobiales bacterium]
MLPPSKNGVLPPGVHQAAWEELEERFAGTPHRRVLSAGLKDALIMLGSAGCRAVYVDGSFVTDKEVPNDFDVCWDPTGVDLAALDPVFKDLAPPRGAQKARFGGELFPDVVEMGSGLLFSQFFQRQRSGEPKGIVAIDPRSMK